MRKTIALLLAIAAPAAIAAPFEVCWQNPTQNVDGSDLTDLASVRLYLSTSPGTDRVAVGDYATTDPGAEICAEFDADPGDYYATMTALDVPGNESGFSNEITKTVADPVPEPPVLLTEPSTVYTVVKQPDRFVLLPIGIAPAGTTCSRTQTVNGYGVVPNDAVEWSPGSTARPIVVVAQCDG